MKRQIVHTLVGADPGSPSVRCPSRRPGLDLSSSGASARSFSRADYFDRSRALSRELYDDVGQSLVALKLSIYRVERSLIQEIENVSAETMAITDRLIEQLRLLSDSLLPITLEDFGLRRTLEDLFSKFEESTSLKVRFVSEGTDERLPPAIEAGIYRIVHEALVHILGRLGDGDVKVLLEAGEGNIRIAISASGRGLDSPSVSASGAVIDAVVRSLGGTVTFKNCPGRIRLMATLPLPPERPV